MATKLTSSFRSKPLHFADPGLATWQGSGMKLSASSDGKKLGSQTWQSLDMSLRSRCRNADVSHRAPDLDEAPQDNAALPMRFEA
ncbi:hypothetical protein GRI89_12575 [Altererythrobacter salegens]|uniref:Uncharacterized protein n=1 Tax=Croceibacterium salegens TaxID=1737568 RepID=A0A6I4SW79_9SPHN|nr:hypothetical protein [Croceibacterium salegens]MXO60374.1 hypothetical protein [Croceibacterium salegens]